MNLVRALVGGEGAHLLGAAGIPVAIATCVAAWAAALGGAAPAAGNPLGLPGASAFLAAAVLEAAALCVAWERAGAAADRYADAWQTLVARGASRLQVALLLVLTGLPLAGTGAACGAVAGAAARAAAWAILHVPPAGHAPAVLIGMAAGLAVAACASLGVAAAVLGRPRHHRQVSARWAGRIPADLALLLLGGYLGLRTLHLSLARAAAAAGAGPAPPTGAFGAGAPAAPPGHVPEWIVAAGGALLLWGAALAAGRIVSWAVAGGLVVLSHRLAPVPLLAGRAAARAARPLRLVLVPALAAAALAYTAVGAAGAIRTGAYLRTVQIGADLQVQMDWPACGVCGLQPGTVPPIQNAAQDIPGAAAVAPLVDAEGSIGTTGGSASVTLIGIPPGFGTAAVWPSGADGGHLAAVLAASPFHAVVSTALAARLQLRPGDSVAIPSLGFFTVAAVAPLWPVDGSPGGYWVAVPWLLFSHALIGSNAYLGSGINVDVLVRPQPGASPAAIAAALQRQAQEAWLQFLVTGAVENGTVTAGQVAAAVQSGRAAPLLATVYPKMSAGEIEGMAATAPTVTGVFTRALPPAASRRVPLALTPLAAAALLLLGLGAATSPEGSAGLPSGNGLLAIGAAVETAKARRGLRLLSAFAGVAAGAAAGVGAAALFWPALLLLAPPGAVYVAFRTVWWPAWIGAILAVGTALAGAAWAAQRGAPDPVVAGRLAARASPEPPPLPGPAVGVRLGRAAAALRGWLSAAFRPGRAGGALLILAVRRLSAARGRVAALAAGLLIAATVAATVPVFAEGAMTRVLRSFDLQTTAYRPDGAVLFSYQAGSGPMQAAELTRIGAIAAAAGPRVGLPATPPVAYLQSQVLRASPAGAPAGMVTGFLTVDALPDLAAHAEWVQGSPPSAQPEADGTIDAAATAGTMAGQGGGPFQLGQVYVLTPQLGGPSIRIRITGVFAERDPGNDYWPYRYFDQDVFVAPAVLHDLAFQQHAVTLQEASWYTVLDFGALSADRVPRLIAGLQSLGVRTLDASRGAQIAVSPASALALFVSQEQALVTLLRLASLPVLGLVLYFVAITAGVVVDAEAGEIASHASRGASLGQLLGIYLAEWAILALPLTAAAVPLGALFARAMGASVGFLRFTAGGGALPVIWQGRDFAYAGAAALLAVGAALLPVAASARRSIVEARSRASRLPSAPLWQRAYLDVAALALLAVVWTALRGGAAYSGQGLVGPAAIYVLPAVFLLAVGLLAVRALGAILRFLDRRVGGRAPLPFSLPLRRVGRLPAQFAPLLVLLCLTGALGTFSAASARTLQANLGAEVDYTVGSDLRLVEASSCSIAGTPPPPLCARYGTAFGPDTTAPRALPPFSLNLAQPGVAAGAQMVEVPVSVGTGGQSVSATLVLVDPSTFGAVAWWGPRLDPEPEGTYLNLLRSRPDAALLSPDLAGRLQQSSTLQVQVTGGPAGTLARLGVVPRWPGADVTGSMVVAPLGAEPALGIACPVLVLPPPPPPGKPPSPPPVSNKYCPGSQIALLRISPRAQPAAILAGLGAAGLQVSQADLASAEVRAAQRGPEWAGQSGMLSVGFLVALAVAAAGYLLYAWLLLHGQLGQLGLLRAVGVDRRALVEAVAAEQGILVAAGAIAGVLAGIAASLLFVPLYQPEFTGAGGPPFIAAGPGPAVLGLVALLLGLLALAVGLLLALLQRLHIGDSVKIEL